jgi:hypothetical protein
MKDVVDFARQVVEMDRELRHLRAEVERLSKVEKQYNDLLDSSLNHSRVMAGNMLKMCLTPGVTEALVAAGPWERS